MFEKTATILDRFCIHDDEAMPLSLDKPRPRPVRDEISTRTIALAYSLKRAAIYVCHVAGNMEGLSPFRKLKISICSHLTCVNLYLLLDNDETEVLTKNQMAL